MSYWQDCYLLFLITIMVAFLGVAVVAIWRAK